MRFQAGIPTVFSGLLLASKISALPVGAEQQPIFLPEAELHDPTSYALYPLQSTIRDVLHKHLVIGDVLDDFEPSYYLDIKYPKNHESVLLGNDIPVDSVSSRPVFTFHSIDAAYSPPRKSDKHKKSAFTLILTDPDAKSRDNPKWSEMCHWILTNLTTPVAPDPPRLLKAKAGEIEEYLPPGPPPKTGAHRYVFVLLEGDTTSLKAPKDRKHWGYDKPRHGVRDWAKDNGLTVVGANFFYAENEKQ
ncbi:carboxypeptidase Y inhibitor [Cladophialophora chaetospira]|uniref:Carboxypeptidase Y inhibitor n=1 Tax=Cladophialophora chaetospira TaxID=386627 RepID=A0AA38WY25_9EURO|nr:carboxypeptidase Y inhibitor [Cladophialophora chaetospira]